MSKNIFKLSFEDSTKIVQSAFWVEDWTFHEKRKITSFNSNSGFFIRIMGILIFGGFSIAAFFMGHLYYVTDPTKLVENNVQANELAIKVSFSLRPLLVVLLCLVGIFCFILLFPPRNFAWYRIINYSFLSIMLLLIVVGITPLGTSITYNRWGQIPTYLTFIYFLLFVLINFYNSFMDKKRKLSKNNLEHKQISSIKFALGYYILCLLIVIFTKTFNLKDILMGSALFGSYTLSIFIFRLGFDSFLTFYYILKYPKQYRIFYKIPDSAWWMSTRRANKHEHVYPVPKENKRG